MNQQSEDSSTKLPEIPQGSIEVAMTPTLLQQSINIAKESLTITPTSDLIGLTSFNSNNNSTGSCSSVGTILTGKSTLNTMSVMRFTKLTPIVSCENLADIDQSQLQIQAEKNEKLVR